MFANQHLIDRPWEEIEPHTRCPDVSILVNFVKTGDPNGEGLPAWPASTEQFLRLDENVRMDEIISERKRAFYAAYVANKASGFRISGSSNSNRKPGSTKPRKHITLSIKERVVQLDQGCVFREDIKGIAELVVERLVVGRTDPGCQRV